MNFIDIASIHWRHLNRNTAAQCIPILGPVFYYYFKASLCSTWPTDLVALPAGCAGVWKEIRSLDHNARLQISKTVTPSQARIIILKCANAVSKQNRRTDPHFPTSSCVAVYPVAKERRESAVSSLHFFGACLFLEPRRLRHHRLRTRKRTDVLRDFLKNPIREPDMTHQEHETD